MFDPVSIALPEWVVAIAAAAILIGALAALRKANSRRQRIAEQRRWEDDLRSRGA